MHAREEGFERAEDFQIGPYLVYKRPYFEAFLQRVQQSFSLAVWTSSGADYAREAVQNLFLEDIQLEFVWTSERCTSRLNLETFEQYWIKDLRKEERRGYSLERVLMLDDSPEKLERHYGNWLPSPAFGGNSSDTATFYLFSSISPRSKTCGKWKSDSGGLRFREVTIKSSPVISPLLPVLQTPFPAQRTR